MQTCSNVCNKIEDLSRSLRDVRSQIGATLLALSILLAPDVSRSEVFLLPADPNDNVIGELRQTAASETDTLVDIARQFDVGYNDIVSANPQLNRWVPGRGAKVLIPSRYVLPDARREGIVINLAEFRIYYFPPSKMSPKPVITFPISVGRMDWHTPLGTTKIVAKEKDPAWRPPPSIKAEHAREGELLPDVIPGGREDNPLGHYALKLGIPGYLIHGVDERKAFGIGMRVTHGCIRMYPEDIKWLFNLVSVGTPVYIADQPIKLGWRGGTLYLEVHNPLEEEIPENFELSDRIDQALTRAWRMVGDIAEVDEDAVVRAVNTGDGVPTPIARTSTGLPPAKGGK